VRIPWGLIWGSRSGGDALQEKERRSVGKQSPENDIAKAKDVCRFTEDRIEVMQYLSYLEAESEMIETRSSPCNAGPALT
jgi:hypothetical protein